MLKLRKTLKNLHTFDVLVFCFASVFIIPLPTFQIVV